MRFLMMGMGILFALAACGTSPGGDGESRGSIVTPDEKVASSLDAQVQSGGIFCTATVTQSPVASGAAISVRVEVSKFDGSYRIVNSSINGRQDPISYVTTAFVNASSSAVTKKINVRVVDETSATYLCTASVSVLPR